MLKTRFTLRPTQQLIRMLCFVLACGFAMSIAAAQSKFAKLDDARIHYLDYGKGTDAIVLIHGWTMNVKRAVLVGHSMGTPIAREFYRNRPEQTVVVDGPLRPKEFNATVLAFLAKNKL